MGLLSQILISTKASDGAPSIHRWPHLIHQLSRVYPKPGLPLPVSTASNWPTLISIHSRLFLSTDLLIGSLFSTQKQGQPYSFRHRLSAPAESLSVAPHCYWSEVDHVCTAPAPLRLVHTLCVLRALSDVHLPSVPKVQPAGCCRRGSVVPSAWKAALPQPRVAASSWQRAFPRRGRPGHRCLTPPSSHLLLPLLYFLPSMYRGLSLSWLVTRLFILILKY